MGIVSSIAGRLRLRHPVLRQPKRLAQLEQELSAWLGVLVCTSNARTGSLLLHYDVTVLAPTECERRALAALQAFLPAAPAQSPRPAGPKGSTRVRANRWAKSGMLLSLAATLLLAAAGAKRWHTVGGLLFLHALGVHLWVHRHHVLK